MHTEINCADEITVFNLHKTASPMKFITSMTAALMIPMS